MEERINYNLTLAIKKQNLTLIVINVIDKEDEIKCMSNK
jgi:hypothetical protein